MTESTETPGMLIVAGWLRVDPARRDEYVAGSAETVRAARNAAGCLDFVMAADLVDLTRINVYERWADEESLLAFRGSGPSDDQQAQIEDAEVLRYMVGSVGPA